MPSRYRRKLDGPPPPPKASSLRAGSVRTVKRTGVKYKVVTKKVWKEIKGSGRPQRQAPTVGARKVTNSGTLYIYTRSKKGRNYWKQSKDINDYRL